MCWTRRNIETSSNVSDHDSWVLLEGWILLGQNLSGMALVRTTVLSVAFVESQEVMSMLSVQPSWTDTRANVVGVSPTRTSDG